MAATTFPGYHRAHCTPEPGGSLAQGWRSFNEADPAFEPRRLRGAFLDRTLVGGYIHDERWLRLHGARLRTGYVGAVVTAPAHRGRGVASALMLDSLMLAGTHGQTLLVLRGIADYYHRFGYADVMEVTEHAVECERVLALPAADMRVRPASIDDTAALLELYERHYYPFPGAYERTLEQQQHLIQQRSNPPLLAVDPAGRGVGYLLLPCGADCSVAVEAAADSWPAALALLQCHARSAATAEVCWPLPLGSSTYHHLADNLPLLSRSFSRPNADWMARSCALGELVAGLLPLWQERWRRSSTGWSGVVDLVVDGEHRCLQLATDEVRLVQEPPEGAALVRLSAGVLAQLVFGHRPAAWAAARADQLMGEKLVPVFAALFPTTTAWYAGSNRC